MARSFTPDYASPEQLRGEPISTASDLYSLGVVLFGLLTGRAPYQLRSPNAAKLIQSTVPPQQELLYTLAESYESLGALFSIRAQKTIGKKEQLVNWKAAQGSFRKSLAIWNKIPKSSRLSTYGFEVSLPGEVSQRLAACDSQIQRLENRQANLAAQNP